MAVVSAQTDTQKYRQHFWGVVTDETERPQASILVCVIPLGIPLRDELPFCTRTDKDGEYALTVKFIAGKLKYKVVATRGKLPVRWDKDQVSMSAEPTDLIADGCRQINLQFKPRN